jgi:hypothetical protein
MIIFITLNSCGIVNLVGLTQGSWNDGTAKTR